MQGLNQTQFFPLCHPSIHEYNGKRKKRKEKKSVKKLKKQVLKTQAHTSSSSFLMFILLFSSSEWASFSWRCTSCISLRARSFCSSSWTLRACVSSLKDTFKESYWQKDGGRQDKTKTELIFCAVYPPVSREDKEGYIQTFFICTGIKMIYPSYVFVHFL